jgi:hypothetical protein
MGGQCREGVYTVRIAMVGIGREGAFSSTASDGRDVFRDGHWAVLGPGCSQLWSDLERDAVRGGQRCMVTVGRCVNREASV